MEISRRSLVKAGLLAAAGSGLGAAVPLATEAETSSATALAPEQVTALRQRQSLDEDWRFAFGNLWEPAHDFGFGMPSRMGSFAKANNLLPVSDWRFDDSHWRKVRVPHDWAVELPIVKDLQVSMQGSRPVARTYPETSVGWYRKRFPLPKEALGQRIVLEFDGVFRDARYFLNGYHLDRHESGYTPFSLDITDYAVYGGDNILTVRVDASQQEGWFYEGAGIYRHVWLTVKPPLYIETHGVSIRSVSRGSGAEVRLGTELANGSESPARVTLRHRILDAGGAEVASATVSGVIPAGQRHGELVAQARLGTARLWSPADPYLYMVETTLFIGAKPIDSVRNPFGVRSAEFDAERGFLLNGTRLPIQGTCNHQDYAGVGVAVPDFVHAMRVERLKSFGCNAFRTHHAITPEFLDACDRLGMLVLAENRWESSTPQGREQLEALIRRDRNRPSIFAWSLANEEPGQGTETGARILKSMKDTVYRLDPTRLVTAAMNGEFGKGFSAVVDVQGFNYKLDDIDAFRKEHPHKPCLGTEVASTLFTRGEYHDNPKRGLVNAYDRYAPRWGETAETWMQFYDARPWLSGGFVWTGYDYRGEPTPFLDVSVSSQFGILDTCGFAKDVACFYKAWWQTEPVLHLLPHWNWSAGEVVEVWCFSNLDRVELFLNGASLGSQAVPRLGHVQWNVPFTPGILEVRGVTKDGRALTDRRQTAGAAARLKLTANRTQLRADGLDGCQIDVEVVDAAGIAVPRADALVRFQIDGAASILGVGNGDPNSYEADKANERRAFNGRCAAIVQAGRSPGDVRILAQGEGLQSGEIVLELTAG